MPCDYVTDYIEAQYWSDYSSQIQGYGCPPKAILTLTGGTTVEIPDDFAGEIYNFELEPYITDIVSAQVLSAVSTLGYAAFSGATNMTAVTISDSVSFIMDNAFQECSSLLSITIPSGVTYIGQYCFEHCTSLTAMTFEPTNPPSLHDTASFDNTNDSPIFVPCDSVVEYTSVPYWTNLASRIQGYGDCTDS